MSTLYEKLKQVEARYDEMSEQLSSPEVLADSARIQKLAKNHSDLAEIVAKYRKWKKIEQGLREAKQMANDTDDLEMRQMAHEEEKQLNAQLVEVEEELKVLLLPRDPLDEKNVILEIRAGTGGDEAGLFAGELFRMYSRYAETQGWKVEVLESSPTSLGGVKDITAAISGQKVYSKLKYESGVHRVQRVPATEQQGRIHTSAATVAVLPEADEIDIKIEAKDLRIDTFCSSGPGGQSVNTTYSAVRITHLPTALSFRSRTKNRKLKIARKPCAFFVRGFTNWKATSSTNKSLPSAADKSVPAIAPKKFAPTIFRRIASRITALALRFINWATPWTGKSARSWTRLSPTIKQNA